MSDIISRLMTITVPTGHPWISGIKIKEETDTDMLRSILAQLEFIHVVQAYHSQGYVEKSTKSILLFDCGYYIK